jgi:hypothetical protein
MNDLDWNQAHASRFVACVGVTDLTHGEVPSPEAWERGELPEAT